MGTMRQDAMQAKVDAERQQEKPERKRPAWYAEWKAKKEAKEQALRDKGLEPVGPKQLWKLACEAGRAAAEKCVPVPMVVEGHANPLDDNSPVTKRWVVDSGVCGFAWVTIRPARGKFVQWCRKNDIGRTNSYSGGFCIWIGDYGQSYEKKMAHARAAADVLRQYGLEAYADGRLD